MGYSLAQDTLKLCRVMGLEHTGLAWQVQVPQARDPKAQGCSTQQGWQQPTLGAAQRPQTLVSS